MKYNVTQRKIKTFKEVIYRSIQFSFHNMFSTGCSLLPDSKEVKDIIMDLKISAPGRDGIHASLIKENILPIIEPLRFICALSMDTGTIPHDLKIAKVVPLFKTGDPGSFTNYQPISILPCFSKTLEKLVYKRILDT